MKRYADNKYHVREHSIPMNDCTLVMQKKLNKFTPCFKSQLYAVTSVKGNMTTAGNYDEHVITRDASKMKIKAMLGMLRWGENNRNIAGSCTWL